MEKKQVRARKIIKELSEWCLDNSNNSTGAKIDWLLTNYPGQFKTAQVADEWLKAIGRQR